MFSRPRFLPAARSLRVAGALLAAGALLTACGGAVGTESGSSSGASGAGNAAAAELNITDPGGHSVKVPGDIKAALGFYTTDVDILMTLGIPLAKQQPIRGDSGYTTFPAFFPQEPLKDVTPFANFPEFNYEKVLDAEPDFILSGLGYDAKTHDKLAAIAPTYTVNAFDGKFWGDHFKKTATDLGRLDKYEAWEKSYKEQAAAAKKEIDATGNGNLTVAAFGFFEGKGNVACYSGVQCNVFDTMGLAVTPLSKDEKLTISPEQLDKLKDVDAVWMSIGIGETGQKEFKETIATLERSPLWKDLKFVKNKRIYTFEMEMTYGSPSGTTAFVEQVRKDLTGKTASAK